ncbi:protein-serine O-palmitoleoyltransferase porcupine-like, partial [Oppia nitens]|uniref:protein-serine O-palmitoleoyltransferase porcupine-like n=1 Tax=Oppia nitens TaxID=1686743 RepID=UPI0023DB85C3
MDYYEEYSDYLNQFIENDYVDVMDNEDNYDVFNDCVFPTLNDGINKFLAPIVVSNVILKFVTLFINKLIVKQLLTIATGLLLLFYHFYDDLKLFVILCAFISTGAVMSLMSAKHKTKLWMFSIGLICINESIVWLNPHFIRLRSHQMLLVMKIISFNSMINQMQDNSGKDLPIIGSLISSLNYILHPLSSLLGVWHPFEVEKTNKSLKIAIIECIYYLLISVMFLLLSTCLIHYYIGQRFISYIVISLTALLPLTFIYLIEICLTVYITALQFRFSHYFICFATQSMLQLWNSDIGVTNVMSIEMPRSLVSVVIAWNIPMHLWLHSNVFLPSKRSFGAFKAIFITYIISSFLHGFNFQIWSVLLSLGLLTKIEYELRQELSKIFSACIHVRRCHYKELSTNGTTHETNKYQSIIKFWNFLSFKSKRKVCDNKWHHRYTEYNCKWVSVVNILFACLAVSHLAYLGSTFDGKEESSFVSNVISVWSELKYFSHITALITFIIYF